MKPTDKQVGYVSHLAKSNKLLKPNIEKRTLRNGSVGEVDVSQVLFEDWVRHTYDRRNINQLINLLELVDKDMPGSREQFERVYEQGNE